MGQGEVPRGSWHVTALGSGGWMPTEVRETSCYALRAEEQLLLLDAGTGVRRLVTEPSRLDGVERLDVLLTHFHADHLIGLSYLPALPRRLPVTIWAPGRPHYGAPEAVLRAFLGSPYQPTLGGPDQPGIPGADVHEISVDGSFVVGRLRISARWQLGHSDPSMAFRVSDALTYCTDTPVDPGNVEFARGSRLLLHEAWGAEDLRDLSHSRAAGAASIALAAGVEDLVLVHANPLGDDALVLADARGVFPRARVAQDLNRFYPWRTDVR